MSHAVPIDDDLDNKTISLKNRLLINRASTRLHPSFLSPSIYLPVYLIHTTYLPGFFYLSTYLATVLLTCIYLPRFYPSYSNQRRCSHQWSQTKRCPAHVTLFLFATDFHTIILPVQSSIFILILGTKPQSSNFSTQRSLTQIFSFIIVLYYLSLALSLFPLSPIFSFVRWFVLPLVANLSLLFTSWFCLSYTFLSYSCFPNPFFTSSTKKRRKKTTKTFPFYNLHCLPSNPLIYPNTLICFFFSYSSFSTWVFSTVQRLLSTFITTAKSAWTVPPFFSHPLLFINLIPSLCTQPTFLKQSKLR